MFHKISKVVAVALLTFFTSSVFAAQLVDINKADAVTIAENLNGIGDTKAKAIVAYRVLHGDFKNADELVKVKGIGAKLVDRNREFISTATAAIKPVSSTSNLAGETPNPPVLPTTAKGTIKSLSQPASN